jgi:Flp pilus assembly protein TadG
MCTRSSRRGRGQALAEFALVAPVFFMLLFGIIEAGRFIFYYEILNNATREGARYAIVNGENSFNPTGPPQQPGGEDVIARVRAAAFGVPGSLVAVTPTWAGSPANNERGTTVTVSATYTYSSMVPIVPLPPITVTAESSLVVNN